MLAFSPVFDSTMEGLYGIRPSVTLDVMSSSPLIHKQIQSTLEGESSS